MRSLFVIAFWWLLAVTTVAVAQEDGGASRRGMEEIIVTANRRAENVQEVPNSLRVLDGVELEKLGTEGFEDYVFSIPGADLVNSGLEKKIAIRGIGNVAGAGGANGSTSPIGIYLNDTPIQGNGVLPDLALYDLQRIEVLKGPQGTLYGEGAQGGAIKMLLNKADPSEIVVKGEASMGQTSHASGIDNTQALALNFPILRDRLGIRLVGSRKWDSGYVDYFNLREEHANDTDNLMGRVHLDGEVWEGFGASAMLFHQRQRSDQFPDVQLEEGDLRNRNTEPQFDRQDFTLASLALDYDLGFGTVTSSTSGYLNDRHFLVRFPFLGPILSSLLGMPTPSPAEQEWNQAITDQSSLAQEIRVVSANDSWLTWIAGAYYRQRDNDFDAFVDNDLTMPPEHSIHIFGVESFEQLALFGQANLSLPWSFTLDLGLRGFREEQHYQMTAIFGGPLRALGIFAGDVDGSGLKGGDSSAVTAFTPKVSLAWHADDLRMLYATVAQGVRSGGTNLQGVIGEDVSRLFGPDYLWTYEIGAKTQWLDGLLTANLAAFYNDWKDLQIQTTQEGHVRGVPGATLTAAVILNASRAFSRGIELELLALPVEDLTMGFSSFVGDGEIVEGDAAGLIPDHEQLPQLANLSWSLFAGYQATRWPFLGFTPFAHFDTQHVGDRTMSPPTGIGSFPLDAFQTFNTLLGLESDRWQASFGVKNLTDSRSQMARNLLERETFSIARPRSWILKLGVRF